MLGQDQTSLIREHNCQLTGIHADNAPADDRTVMTLNVMNADGVRPLCLLGDARHTYSEEEDHGKKCDTHADHILTK